VIRIVATADNHLGRYYARLSVPALETRRRYLRRAFEQACQYALDRQADLFLIGGDLFDITAPRNVERTHIAMWLAKLREAGIRVFAVAGNHDSPRSRTDEGGYCALEVYEAARLLHFFRELSGDPPTITPQALEIRGQTVVITGFSPNLALREDEDPLAGLTYELPPADLRLLLTHMLIEGWVHPEARGPLTRPSRLEALRDVDLVIAGDLHDFRLGRFGGVQVVVPGATEWMDYGEVSGATPGFVDIQFESPGCLNVQHIDITPQPRCVVEIGAAELDPSDPTSAVVKRVENELATMGKDPLIRLRLHSIIEREVMGRLNLASVADQLRGRLCELDLDTTGLQMRRERGAAAPRSVRRTLRDELLAAISEVVGDLDDDDRAALPAVEQEILAVFDGDARGAT
jgi:DNA repair exonuclease SbcCD nuclease subunit